MRMRELMDIIKDALTEGRDAGLFHGTTVENAALILQQGVFAPKTVHVIDKRKVAGVSLTRLRSKASGFGSVIFEFDQAAMVRRGDRFVPVNHKPKRVARPMGDTEFEEFHIGAIENLDAILRGVWVTDRMVANYQSGDTYFDRASMAVILEHPKLRVRDTSRWVRSNRVAEVPRTPAPEFRK